MSQTEIINLEDLVPANHMYRKFIKLWSFANVEKQLSRIETENNHKGYGMLRLFKCLDVSDRDIINFKFK